MRNVFYWCAAAWWIGLFISYCCGIDHNSIIEGCAYLGTAFWFLEDAIKGSF